MPYIRPTRSSAPPVQHTLIYDAGCPFCTASAYWLRDHARRPLSLMTFAETRDSGLLTRLSEEEVEATVHFVTPSGIEYHSGEAVTRALRLLRFGGLASVLEGPGFGFLRELGYSLVARARPLLSRWIRPREA